MMELTVPKIIINSAPVDISLLPVKESNILKFLGVPEGKAEEYLIRMIGELTEYCKTICTPRSACTVFANPGFRIDQGSMVLCGERFALNKMVTSALKESTAIAVFIGTCGNEVEKYSKLLLQQGHTLEGFIVDLIGSELAEGIADYTHNRIIGEMSLSGINVTNRYSPGYCNWPVNDQKQLFKLMADNNCGVVLSESSLMLPIKSVSGIIGLGHDVINRGYACAYCETDQCIYRDKK